MDQRGTAERKEEEGGESIGVEGDVINDRQTWREELMCRERPLQQGPKAASSLPGDAPRTVWDRFTTSAPSFSRYTSTRYDAWNERAVLTEIGLNSAMMSISLPVFVCYSSLCRMVHTDRFIRTGYGGKGGDEKDDV